MRLFKSLKAVEVVPGGYLKSVRCSWGLKSPVGLEFLLELLKTIRASKTKVKVIFCGRYYLIEMKNRMQSVRNRDHVGLGELRLSKNVLSASGHPPDSRSADTLLRYV